MPVTFEKRNVHIVIINKSSIYGMVVNMSIRKYNNNTFMTERILCKKYLIESAEFFSNSVPL